MSVTDRVYMYHETEAPEGRIFDGLNAKAAADLDSEGWVDTPAKFGSDRAKEASREKQHVAAPQSRAADIDKMNNNQVDDYIARRGGVPEGSLRDKKAFAKTLPTEPANTAPNDADEALGKKPVEDMDEDELRAELEDGDVKDIPADATKAQLISGVMALREE